MRCTGALTDYLRGSGIFKTRIMGNKPGRVDRAVRDDKTLSMCYRLPLIYFCHHLGRIHVGKSSNTKSYFSTFIHTHSLIMEFNT